MEIKSIDESTFEVVYETYAQKVHRVALCITGSKEVAEDITQTVFMKLYQHRNNINVKKIESWLMIVADHLASNYKRDYKREELIGNVEQFIDLYVDKVDSNIVYMESLEDNYIKKLTIEERVELVHKIYTDLYHKDKRWHEAMMTTYMLERTQKEVAETMGISLGALQLILFRAKKWIKKEYQKQFEHLEKQ